MLPHVIMQKKYIILLAFLFLDVLFCWSSSNSQSFYQEGRQFYINGEFTNAVSAYLKCISHGRKCDGEEIAYSYRDLATICHLEGNHKMALEINEQSVKYFERAGLFHEYNYALCRTAVYKASLGHDEEALTILRHVMALDKDSIIHNTAETYFFVIQSGQIPEINESPLQTNPSELYTSVETIKHELFRKPKMAKILIICLVFLCCAFGIYNIHSGLTRNLHDLRKERINYQQQYEKDINLFCDFLKTHPDQLKNELHWGSYAKMCSIVNVRLGNLIQKLHKNITLNETETRLCVLVLIDLPRNLIADILPYAPNSVGKLKNTVAKKLQSDGKNLRNFLQEMARNPAK